MAASEDPSAVAELVTEAVAPIREELRQRLTAELGERDLVAIESALLKAFVRGMHTAKAETAEAVIDHVGPAGRLGGELMASSAHLDDQLSRLDPWAERYGGG